MRQALPVELEQLLRGRWAAKTPSAPTEAARVRAVTLRGAGVEKPPRSCCAFHPARFEQPHSPRTLWA